MYTIKLTQDKVAYVSEEDFEEVSKYRWSLTKTHRVSYATTRIGGKTIYMHRLIMNAPEGKQVDHINHDGLDNRRENLRIVTQNQNLANMRVSKRNKSGYKGVSWDSWTGRWQACICENSKMRHLGRFDTAKEAAIAYDNEAKKIRGEYALLNFSVGEQ